MSCVYFIGGASASGKSWVAQSLAQKHCLPLIHLDEFHNALRSVPASGSDLEEATKAVCLVATKQLLMLGRLCIVEGGWIDPDVAASLFGSGEVVRSAVYCGYGDNALEQKYDSIVQGGAHWLAKRPRGDALEFLKDQVRGSEWYRDGCTNHGISYIDFTEFDDGTRSLECHFNGWFTRNSSDA